MYLLANRIDKALYIILEKIQDIQLGILLCKFRETPYKQPKYEKIIKEKFIEGGIKNEDPWLTSIGHALLKEYVQCVNCLYHFSNKKKDILMLANDLK